MRAARRASMGCASELAAADAAHLPFADASFDAAFAVAVLQHVERARAGAGRARAGDAARRAAGERRARQRARATGSASPAVGHEAFELATRFFAALDDAARRAHARSASLGPRLPGLLRARGFEALAVHLFPVSVTRLGAPVPRVWDERRAAVDAAIDARRRAASRGSAAISCGRRALRGAGARRGPAFVEIQNTMLFATVAQRLR